MTTRTIREADITITQIDFGTRHGRTLKYRLDGVLPGWTTVPLTLDYAENYAEALQKRADIVDKHAGMARVGDIVRIGLKGKVHYEVRSVLPWGELGLRPVGESDRLAVRYVTIERAHIVEAHR